MAICRYYPTNEDIEHFGAVCWANSELGTPRPDDVCFNDYQTCEAYEEKEVELNELSNS